MKRYCHILLTNTDTAFSRVLRAATGYSYTHASLSLGDPRRLYSFARLQEDFPLPAGFVHETPGRGVMGRYPGAPCALYEVEAEEPAFLRARQIISEIEQQAPLYKYNILGLPLIRLGIPLNRPYRMVCSQFVAYILESSGILALPKPSSLFTPMDFTALPGLKLVFQGKLGELASAQAQPLLPPTPSIGPWRPLPSFGGRIKPRME